MEIKGKVVTGLNEGSSYVKNYELLFKEKVRFIPFSGTLNIEVKENTTFEGKVKLIVVPEEPFHPVDCFKVRIHGRNNSYPGAIVIPHKTRHEKNILELISPVNLRDELKINDGDEVICELE
jgi:riboflavin kinase, archaea type